MNVFRGGSVPTDAPRNPSIPAASYSTGPAAQRWRVPGPVEVSTSTVHTPDSTVADPPVSTAGTNGELAHTGLNEHLPPIAVTLLALGGLIVLAVRSWKAGD